MVFIAIPLNFKTLINGGGAPIMVRNTKVQLHFRRCWLAAHPTNPVIFILCARVDHQC
uniref:Uncharacterized protein n=1 Tax=Anguilla anguilla TaxID=7936 RepID=A0A0E9Q4P3_ANGAN